MSVPVFEYSVKDKSGKVLKGTVEESSIDKVRERLHAQGMLILSIKGTRKQIRKVQSGRVKPEEVVIFSRQLTTLIESGIPLVQSMDILMEQTKNPFFKSVIDTIGNDLKEGNAFNVALSKHPRVFNQFYVSMAKAGETSGKLAEIIDRVSTYLEETLELNRKIKSSLMYPMVVVGMAFVITAFLILKVIPTFKGIFDQLGGELPLPTKLLIGFSDFSRQWFPLMIVGFVVFIIAFKKYIKTKTGKKQFDSTLLKLPVFGELISKIAVAKFCRTFTTLVSSGVPILTALDIVGSTSGNSVMEEAVLSAKKFVQEGESISEPLGRSNVFPPMVIRMISVGERTGKLQEMLSKIAVFYESEVDSAVSGLTSMIEPLIIGFLGIVIGGIVVSLFLPILKITEMVT